MLDPSDAPAVVAALLVGCAGGALCFRLFVRATVADQRRMLDVARPLGAATDVTPVQPSPGAHAAVDDAEYSEDFGAAHIAAASRRAEHVYARVAAEHRRALADPKLVAAIVDQSRRTRMREAVTPPPLLR